MLELLQEILCFMEQHEKCKECVCMMTEDELRRKHKLERNISSLIIEQLQLNYCIGETALPVPGNKDVSPESEQIPSTRRMEENGGEDALAWRNNEDTAETVKEEIVNDSHDLVFMEPMEKETEILENETDVIETLEKEESDDHSHEIVFMEPMEKESEILENETDVIETLEKVESEDHSHEIVFMEPMEKETETLENGPDMIETLEEEKSVDDSDKLFFKEPIKKETETLQNKTEVILECINLNCPEGTPTEISDKLLLCIFCNKTFLTKSDVEKHTCPQNVQAKHSSWGYINEEDLNDWHFSLHEDGHNIEEYPCDGCDLVFISKDRLRNHAKEKHNILVYKRGSECVAPDCSNNPYSCIKPKRSFHVFPSNPNRFKLWVDNIQKIYPNFQPPDPRLRKKSSLCSDHFTKDCYENETTIHGLCNFRMKNRLKTNAIPTVF